MLASCKPSSLKSQLLLQVDQFQIAVSWFQMETYSHLILCIWTAKWTSSAASKNPRMAPKTFNRRCKTSKQWSWSTSKCKIFCMVIKSFLMTATLINWIWKKQNFRQRFNKLTCYTNSIKSMEKLNYKTKWFRLQISNKIQIFKWTSLQTESMLISKTTLEMDLNKLWTISSKKIDTRGKLEFMKWCLLRITKENSSTSIQHQMTRLIRCLSMNSKLKSITLRQTRGTLDNFLLFLNTNHLRLKQITLKRNRVSISKRIPRGHPRIFSSMNKPLDILHSMLRLLKLRILRNIIRKLPKLNWIITTNSLMTSYKINFCWCKTTKIFVKEEFKSWNQVIPCQFERNILEEVSRRDLHLLEI